MSCVKLSVVIFPSEFVCAFSGRAAEYNNVPVNNKQECNLLTILINIIILK